MYFIYRALIFFTFCVFKNINGSLLCDTGVEVFAGNIAMEGEPFNVTIAFVNVTAENTFKLTSSWTKLNLSEYELHVTQDMNFTVAMTGANFYLYQVRMSCMDQELKEHFDNFDIPVGRTVIDNWLSYVFQKVMFVAIIFSMFLLGCELDFAIVRKYLSKPLAPAAGIFCQYICMPLMAYVIGYGFLRDNNYARYGLIIVGCSPGGTFSNFWTALWEGDVNLSVTMTFSSSVASFVFTTFWIWIFGTFVLVSDTSIKLPYLQLFLSLVSFVAPILLGMLTSYKKPTLGAKLKKICRPFFVVMLVIYMTLGIYANRYFFFVVSWQHFIAPACLGFSGYIIGIIIASLLCLTREQTVALSIETGIQNVNIAVVILQSNLVSPYGDMALLPVIGYLLSATGPPQMILISTWKLVNLLKRKMNERNKDIIQTIALDNKGFSF